MITGWKTLALGAVATLQRGFDLPHRLRKVGDVPIVTSSGFEATHSESRVKAPGVVTGRYGTIGQVFFVETDFWPLNTTLYIRDFHGNDPLFVSYLLRTIDFHSHSGKSGVPGVNRNDLHEIHVDIPVTVSEQKAISVALRDADALIKSIERLLSKKRQIKQGTMEDLLTGQRRLPGFGEEWKVVCLGSLSSFYKGKGLPKSSIKALASEKCIHYGELFTKYPEIIGEVISRTDVSKDVFRSEVNDVLMPTSDVTPRGLAKASCVLIGGVILGGDILVIRPDERRLQGSFLSYLIRFDEYQILQLVTGTTVFHLYGSDMKKFTFSLPPVEEQAAIVRFLSVMTDEITILESQLQKARHLKQGMMQELLTGRIRLV